MSVQQNLGGKNYISTTSTSPYQDIYKQFLADQEAQKNQDRIAWESRKNQDTSKLNSTYDTSSKQNYLNYMQNQKALPSQLQKLGVNGGASESALLRLNTAYGNNIANNESARNTALSELANTYEKEWGDYLNEYNTNLTNARTKAQENDIAYQRELDERDVQRFAASITGRFRSIKSYKNLINKLRKSNDPNKNYKIALAQQAMSALQAEKAKSSGGGGGGYGSSYGYGSSSSSSGGSSNSGSGSGSGSKTKKTKDKRALNQKYSGSKLTNAWLKTYGNNWKQKK